MTYSSTSVLAAFAVNAASDRREEDVDELAVGHRHDAHPREEPANQRGLDAGLVGFRRLDRFRLRAHQREQALPGRMQPDTRAVGRRLGAVELRDVLQLQLADHATRQLAAAEDPVLGVVVRHRILPVRVGRRNARHGRRPFVFDEETRLRLVADDVRVALNHQDQRRQHEHRRRHAAVSIENREPIEQMHVAIGRVRRRLGRAHRAGWSAGGLKPRLMMGRVAHERPSGGSRRSWTAPRPRPRRQRPP